MTLDRAVDVFVRAFSSTMSRTYPYVVSDFEGLKVMHDHPPRKKSRKIEVVAWELEPTQVLERIARQQLGWHFVCHFSETPEESKVIREKYKDLGYRMLSTERLFIHDLKDIPVFESRPKVVEICSQHELDQVHQVASQKRKHEEGNRLFGVWNDSRDIGWVRSIPVEQDAWVSALHVHPEYRRQGYGQALMSSLLRRDKEVGVNTSVLLASVAGSKLYPILGYEEIAALQIFCPKER